MSHATIIAAAQLEVRPALRPHKIRRVDQLLELASLSRGNSGVLMAVIHELSFRSTDAAVKVARQVAEWHAEAIQAETAAAELPQQIFADNDSWPVKDDWRDNHIANLFFYYSRHCRRMHEHDAHTRLILRLKDNDAVAVRTFADKLETLLCGSIAVAVVPGHDPAATVSGLRALGREVARRHNRIDATAALARTVKIEKLSQGGSRDASVHEASIRVRDASSVVGKAVILLDDVTTSGNSLNVCRSKLLDCGARRVKMLAIGKTR